MRAKDLKEYISKNEKILDILEHLGMGDILDNGDYYSCSVPDGDNPTGTIVYKNESCNVNCYTRKLKEDNSQAEIINLTAFLLNLEYKSAKNYLANFLGLSNDGSSARVRDNISFFRKAIRKVKSENIHKEQVYYDGTVLEGYSNIPHIDLITKDSLICPIILTKYHVMFDERSDRIIFPHYKWDDDTKICGLVGRTVIKAFQELKIKKYMSMLPTEYIKTQNLYALCWNKEYIAEKRKAIVFEAEKSCMKADMFGYPFCVSVGCHSISEAQKKILLSLNLDEIIIAFDSDVEEEEIGKQCEMFAKYIKVSYIFDKWKLLGEKDSPVDKGIKRWKFLYEHRIEYKKSNFTKDEGDK